MSRPSLLRPLGERHARRQRRPHAASVGVAVAAIPPRACDPAVLRVREAGGPSDHAAYACACGYLFDASVSTSVSCPHCGSTQAW